MTDTIRFEDTIISDMHKDAYGYRPRDEYPDIMTMDEYQTIVNDLQEALGETMEYERARELRAQRRYEERIAGYQAQFGVDRATAMRWDWDAKMGDDPQQEVRLWIYLNGMSYDLESMYRNELREAGLEVHSSIFA